MRIHTKGFLTLSAARIAVYALTILVAAGIALAVAKPELVPNPVKARLPLDSNLSSFEFLGCSGDWTRVAMTPRVWLMRSKGNATFLIQHTATCGYSVGANPHARDNGTELHFDYDLIDDGQDLAACYCEYWATFSLKAMPKKITRVTFDGNDAQMMGSLTRN